MKTKKNEKGFTYIEVIIAILVMTIGILAALSALSVAVLRARESEQKNVARQLTAAALESVFATRDLLQVTALQGNNALNNWNTAVANTTPATPQGIFLTGYGPIRQDSGLDQIEGTADDACQTTNCTVGTYTNSSPVIRDFQREIIITDIADVGTTVIRKKKIVVNIKYFAGQVERVESVSTIVANLSR